MALMADNLRSGHPEQQSTVGQAKGLSGLNNLMADNLRSGHPEQQSTVGTNKGINIQMAENLKNGDIGLSEGAKRAAEINAQSNNTPSIGSVQPPDTNTESEPFHLNLPPMADNLRSGHPEQQSTVGHAKGLSGLNNLMADNLRSGHPEQQSTVGQAKGFGGMDNLMADSLKENTSNSDGLTPSRMVSYDDVSQDEVDDFDKKLLNTDSAREEHISLRKIKSSSDNNVITINFSSAEELIDELEKLKTNQVKSARSSLIECVNLLNFTLKGQVTPISVGIVDTGIEEIEESIDEVISKIQSTINATSDYSNSGGVNNGSENISGTAAAGVTVGGALASATANINNSEEENISGTAVDGVTVNNNTNTTSNESYIDENGYPVGSDAAYVDSDEDISGAAKDGVNVEEETSKVDEEKIKTAKDKVSSMINQLKKKSSSNAESNGDDESGIHESQNDNIETKKSWATYDPENGYNSLELEEKKAAYLKAKKEYEDEVNRLKESGVNVNPSTNLNDKQTIVTPPSDTSNQTPTEHVGGATTPPKEAASETGGYAITGGYTRGNSNAVSTPAPTPTPEPEPVQEPVVETPKPEVENPIEEVVPKESKVTKIPTVTPSTTTKETSSGGGGSRIIPIAAGIGAAAAAGLGAKAYLDRRENTDNGEDDEWDNDVDEGNKPMDISYEDNNSASESVLDEDDEYTTSDEDEIIERYDARANNELADLQ